MIEFEWRQIFALPFELFYSDMFWELFLNCILLVLRLIVVVNYVTIGLSVVIDVVLFGGVVVFTTNTAVVLVTDTTVVLVWQRVKLILVAIVVFTIVSVLVTLAIVLVAESDHS